MDEAPTRGTKPIQGERQQRFSVHVFDMPNDKSVKNRRDPGRRHNPIMHGNGAGRVPSDVRSRNHLLFGVIRMNINKARDDKVTFRVDRIHRSGRSFADIGYHAVRYAKRPMDNFIGEYKSRILDRKVAMNFGRLRYFQHLTDMPLRQDIARRLFVRYYNIQAQQRHSDDETQTTKVVVGNRTDRVEV
ncbi:MULTISPECIES: hypothetical protein [unclassified Chelatococcus]|uniref:hypothetical protein n=1 Tax=unclassified Chelatococcus TaxID=2638111 RepID=UPI001BCCBDDE|nr:MULTISPECIES: hypothetical protein [unclassified Chelatococcus]MBS7700606.1 hypothetical protein [Chelatococcus sp. YT9]MBX3558721.1 hypothetical protein [Chelatococcus sp.]